MNYQQGFFLMKRARYVQCLIFILLFISTLLTKAQATNCTALTQPLNLSVAGNTGTAVTIQWNSVNGASNYQLQTYINGAYQQVLTNTNQATFSNLSKGYYYFNVTAFNSCEEQSTPSAWFGVDVSGIAVCTVPQTPSGLQAINLTGNSFTATWSNVSNAQEYQIQHWDDTQGWLYAGTTTNAHFDFANLAAGNEYVRVGAKNTCGESEFGSYITVPISGVIACPSNLAVAEELVASIVTTDGFTLAWSTVTDADSYDVQLWVNGAWSTIANTSDLAYQVSQRNMLNTQYVRIVARVDCDSGLISESAWISVIYEQTSCPEEISKPTNLVVNDISASGFKVSWSQVHDAASYDVQLWQSGAWVTVATTTSVDHELTGLTGQSTQYIRIIAKTDCTTQVINESEWLEVKLLNDCPSELDAPLNLTLTALSDSSFSAQWQSVSSAKKYQVQLAHNGVWQSLGEQTSISKTLNSLSAGTYQVKVAAVCDDVISPETTPQSITLTVPEQCNLPDVNGGIDISSYGDSFNEFSFAGNIYVQGNGFNPNSYSMEVTCQGDYGFVSHATDHNNDNYVPFTYSYSHFGARSSNVETIQFEIRSGGYMSRKTLTWNLNMGTQQSPVQPSCNDINIDNDVDGIPDCAEMSGKTFFGMPVHAWGARQGQTDIFIEVDYMSKSHSSDHGTEPRKEVFDKVKSIFAQQGYVLHFDVGGLYGQGAANYNLGGGQAVQYSPWIGLSDWRNEYSGNYAVPGMKNNDTYPGVFSYMPVYFDNKPERSRLFYYALFASSQAAGGEGSSGQAPDYFDHYFYVSLGSPSQATKSRWYLNADNEKELNRLINSQSSVFMHELGHVLGLSHGGWPDTYPNYEPNFKPNYPSIMNYAYALSGVPHTGAAISENEMMQDRQYVSVRRDKNSGCMAALESKYGVGVSRRNFPEGLESNWQSYNLDFSYGNKASFSESNFNESYVLGGLDLDCDGAVSNFYKAFNINYDTIAPDYVTARYSNMRDYNDWDNIYLYYRHLNYSTEGKFLMSANLSAKHAIEPANVVPGAISSPNSSPLPVAQQMDSNANTQTSRPVGVVEQPMSPID